MKTLSQYGTVGKNRRYPNSSPNTYEEALRRVSFDDLCRLFESYGSTGKRSGRTASYRCALPTHNDSTPSVSVREEGGRARWKCFGCGEGGDYLDLVSKVEGVSSSDALRKLRESLGLTSAISRTTTRRPAAKPAAPKTGKKPRPISDVLTRTDAEQTKEVLAAYLHFRSWPANVVERFGLEVVTWKNEPYVLHPLRGFVNGEPCLVSWQLRRDPRLPETDGAPKYRNPAGVGLVPFGLETLERDDLEGVVLCEGPADAITATLALEEAGLRSWTALGFVGVKNLPSDLPRLLEGLAVVVAFDNDDAGKDGTKKVVETLGRKVVRLLPPRKDLTDSAKAAGLRTVGEWLKTAAGNEEQSSTSRGVADEESLVAHVLGTFTGSRVVEPSTYGRRKEVTK